MPAPDGSGDPLQAALAEKDRMYDLLLRKAAELDNFRKRVEKDRLEVRAALAADLVKRLLPALDNLHRALVASEASRDPLRQGILMVHHQITEALRLEGVEPMEALGATFDPQLHEAVEARDVEGFEQGVILEEVQKGYTIHGKLLRPAMVKVASGRKGGGSRDPRPGGGA